MPWCVQHQCNFVDAQLLYRLLKSALQLYGPEVEVVKQPIPSISQQYFLLVRDHPFNKFETPAPQSYGGEVDKHPRR